MAVDLLDDDREEPVEQFDDLDRWQRADQSGGLDDIDEKHCHMALFSAQRGPLQFGRRRDFAPDVAAEQIAHPLPFPKPVHHGVETALQLTEFGAVEDDKVGAQVPALDAPEGRAHHPHWSCGEPGQNPHQQEAGHQRRQRDDDDRDFQLRPGQILQQ